MPTNPLKPPESQARDKPPAGSPLRAILVGLIVDIGGSVLVGVLLTILYHSQLVASGMTPSDVDAAMDDIPLNSPVELVSLVLGFGCSVLGGYVCARIVRRDEWRVGAVMATVSATLSLLSATESTPGDLVFLFTVTTAASVMLGVKFGRERNLRPPPPEPPTDDAPAP